MDPVIAGHPIHPILVNVPVGLFPASYALDLAALVTNDDALAEAAYYNMLLGSLGGVAAALAGYWDSTQMEKDDPAHATVDIHGWLNAGLISLYGVNLWLRRNNKRSKLGLLLSTIGTAGLVVSGYLGGEIAYGRGWRVRSAERFELEWQRDHQTGPFAPKNAPPMSVEQKYPPEVIKGMNEKRSGEAVMKEIEQQGKAATTPTPPSRPAGQITQPLGDGERNTVRLDGLDKPSQAEGDPDTINTDLQEKQ